jgi:O-antigen ligase
MLASRGALLGAFFAGIIFVSILFRRETYAKCLLLMFVIVCAFILGKLEPAGTGYASIVAIKASGSSRFEIWQATWLMIKGALFLGHGLGSFSWVYSIFRPITDTSTGNFVHNDFLHIWSELGLIGLLFFYLYLWPCQAALLRAFHKS